MEYNFIISEFIKYCLDLNAVAMILQSALKLLSVNYYLSKMWYPEPVKKPRVPSGKPHD